MGQIPYDLTFKWNISNRRKKQTKYNQKLGNKEQTDRDQHGVRRGITGKEGEGASKGTQTDDSWAQAMWGY